MTTPMPADPAPGTASDNAAQTATDINLELRNLATQMQSMIAAAMANGFAITKAIVTTVNDTTTPPSVSLNIGGDTTVSVDQVRFMNNTTPLVGATVLIAKQKQDIFILGSMAATNPTTVGTVDSGWKKATLSGGSHGGNGNGDVYYRRVLDHGSWRMDWRGGWTVSGTTMVTGLDPDYRPTSKRSIIMARDISGGAVGVQMDFSTDGSAVLVGGNTAQLNGGSHSHSVSGNTDSVDPGDSTTAGGADGHSHGVVGSHSHGWGNGTTSAGTHQHPVNSPGWVSLNNVSYYL